MGESGKLTKNPSFAFFRAVSFRSFVSGNKMKMWNQYTVSTRRLINVYFSPTSNNLLVFYFLTRNILF